MIDPATPKRRFFQSYWSYYGGIPAILRSGYFWTAVALTALTLPWWLTGEWWERAISILPNILGFSLGGYVMLLAVGSETFMQLLARSGKDSSALTGVSAAFVHFIMVQFAALIAALIFMAAHESSWRLIHEVLPAIRLYVRGIYAAGAMLLFYYSLTRACPTFVDFKTTV